MSKICPMCGAFMKTNVCEYCRYEIEVPEEKEEKKERYEEKRDTAARNTIINNEPIYGANQYNVSIETVSGKNRIAAFIICFLFGYFGAHYFYVGRKGAGILYLLTVGIFGIGWIVDLVLIALGKFKDKDGLPLK